MGIVERPWRVYVVGRCAPVRDDEGGAAERYARIVLRRAVHPLPLWLEVGVARLAMAAELVPTGGVQFATFQAADLRGYQYPPVPAREVFSARQTSEVWQNRLRRAAFLRQSLVYVHRVVQAGDLGACTGPSGPPDDPAARLRECLRGDIDPFHEGVMASWPKGADAADRQRGWDAAVRGEARSPWSSTGARRRRNPRTPPAWPRPSRSWNGNRALIDHAAEASGKNRTEFVLDAATREATTVLLDQRHFLLDVTRGIHPSP